MVLRWPRASVWALCSWCALASAPAWAQRDVPGVTDPAVSETLLGRLELHAEGLHQMEKRGSFLLSGKMDELGGNGSVSGTKELVVKVTARPTARVTEILKYLEDGVDKTEEARAKQKRREAEPDDPKKRFMLPFSRLAKDRYRFELAERNLKNPSRVRVRFIPLERAENTYTGSAWVDQERGEILTMILSPTKTPMFVDKIELSVVFENQTSLGRAPSEISFEARGSLLFFKKRYRGSATLTETEISF